MRYILSVKAEALKITYEQKLNGSPQTLIMFQLDMNFLNGSFEEIALAWTLRFAARESRILRL
jgi:hypothetical protein